MMVYVRSKSYMRSRNTLIMFVLLFLAFSVSFRFVMRVVVDNVMILTSSVVDSGYIDPSKFEMSFDSVDFSKLNPILWELDEIRESLNGRLHEFVDIIAPALINLMRMVIAQTLVLIRTVAVMPHTSLLLYDNPYLWLG